MATIILTEEQIRNIKRVLSEEIADVHPALNKKVCAPYCVDPEKVLYVKKFLDGSFKKGEYETIGSDGYPTKIRIAAMLSSTGDVLKNMYKEQLMDLLVDKFQKMFSDKDERAAFLKQVMDDWFDDRIGVHGTLSKNYISLD